MDSYISKRGKEAVESLRKSQEDEKRPDMYVVEFRLKQTLKKRGIKQKELAEMTGLRPSSITNMCRSYLERVSLDHVSRIATALKITDIREILTLVDYYESDLASPAYKPEEDDGRED